MLANRVRMAKSGGSGIPISSIPIGSIVYDANWLWEFKEGHNHTGSGEFKNIEWLVVAKGNDEYTSDSVTLFSKELLAMVLYASTGQDNRYDSSYIRDTFINSTFTSLTPRGFMDLLLTSRIEGISGYGSKERFIVNDKYFIPTLENLNAGVTPAGTIGVDWGYFTDDNSRIAQFDNVNTRYWTRSTPNNTTSMRHITETGANSGGSAFAINFGVRLATNIKENSRVIEKNGKYELVY